jgi:hypothetical protein
MTVRDEIAEPRRETRRGALRTRCVLMQYVKGSEGRSRWPKARRSSGSEIAAEVFMNNAG